MPGLILWLEPTSCKGVLPISSLFLSVDGYIVSTCVLGTFDPYKRKVAYERVLKVLEKRIETMPAEELSVKHTGISLEISSFALREGVSSRNTPSSSHLSDLCNLTSFKEIIKDQELLYGELPEEDKLKLIAQAVYGGAHMLENAAAAWDYLLAEWNSIESLTDEPLAERISPEGDLYRINLRAAKELGIKPEILFDAVLRSAASVSLDLPRRIERILPQALSVGFEPQAIPTVPCRHSVSYRERVKPSYRLLMPVELNDLLVNCV